MDVFLLLVTDEANTTLVLRTHRYRDWGQSTALPSEPWKVLGSMTDLEDPDREMLAISVATRQSEPLGAWLGEMVSQLTCHLNKVTADASTLNRPISPAQLLQYMRRGLVRCDFPMACSLVSNATSAPAEEN